MRMVPGALACALLFISCGGDELLLPEEGEPATLAIVQGDAQTGVAGAPLPEPLVVRVSDTRDRPVIGTAVTFEVSSGGGTVTPETVTTDAEGIAAAQWSLGTRAGAQAVAVAVPGARPPLGVEFDATAGAGAARNLAIVAGQGQAASVGSPLPEPLVVRVADQSDNPVSGVTVTWTPEGGGSVDPASSVTDADGRALTQRTLGPGAGTQITVASAPDVGAPVSFAHTATSGPPSRVTVVSGNDQSAPAGSQLPEPLVVRVLDANDNPVVGRAVTWVIGQGGGSANPVSVNTGADGTASTAWTLGPRAGANTITAVVSGVGSAGFTATGTSAGASRLVRNGGDQQTAPAQTRLGTPLSVRAVDANGNGVAGVNVLWAVTAGGGSLSSASTTTRTDGTAEVTWTLGPTIGAQSVSATATGLQGSPVGFTANATVGAASRLAIITQPSATASSGAPFAQQPVIELRDAAGNPVPQAGVAVTAAIASGGGSLGGTTTRATDGNGRATFTDLSISGSPGSRTLIFAADGFASVTSSTIQVSAGAPSASESRVSANPTTFEAGSGSSTITVTVRDAQGAPLPNVPVQIAVTGSGNSVTQPGSTNGSGVATGSFTSTVAESKTISASADGVAIQQTATVTVTAPPPPPPPPSSDASRTTADVPNGVAGSPTAITVQVRNTAGDPVTTGGDPVAVSVSGANNAGPLAVSDNANGTYSASYIPQATGVDQVRITLGGTPISGSPYTSTVVAATPSQIGFITQPRNGEEGQALRPPIELGVQDRFTNLITSSSAEITVAISQSDDDDDETTLQGTLTRASVNGIATFDDLVINQEGEYTLRATSPGLEPTESREFRVRD